MKNSCNICSKETFQVIYKINQYTLYRCVECQVVFIKPQPNKQLLNENNKYKYNTVENEKVYLSLQNLFESRAKKCIKEIKQYKNGGKLLDVGSSYGFYLKTFKFAGYKVTGIELSNRAVLYSRNILKLNTIKDNFEKHIFKYIKFDVITLFDVIEHFSDPQKSITKIKKILKKDGIIVIQTPNYDSLISKITSSRWYWLLVPQHLFLYSIKTLKFFLKNNGFKILHITTWDDHYEFVSNILSIFGINYWGKTSILHRFLVKIKYALIPISYLWNIFFLGGEIIVYAQKE